MKTTIAPTPPRVGGFRAADFDGPSAMPAPSAAGPDSPRRVRRLFSRYRSRLVAGLLLISVPVMGSIVLLQARLAAQDLTRTTQDSLVADSHRSEAIGEWLSERDEDLTIVKNLAVQGLGVPELRRFMTDLQTVAGDDYDVMELVAPTGRILTSTPGARLDPTGQSWFQRAIVDGHAMSPVYLDGDVLRWVMAKAIPGTNGRVASVVLADLHVPMLVELVSEEVGAGRTIAVVDAQHRLVVDSQMAGVEDDAGLIAKGALTRVMDDPASDASHHSTGSTSYPGADGHVILAGYQPGPEGFGWGITTRQDSADALALVSSLRRAGLLLLLVGIGLLICFSFLFASGEVRRIRALIQSSRNAGTAVSERSTELSTSSEELAATTTEQSAAVTETSATMEELSRTSASIADTVERIASQASETKDSLQQAEVDVHASSERTLSLSERVNQVGAILELINEIADQTNLLALNAAIEAARAGDNGRGFAVVAEEVRRLAERSKASASEIAVIIESTRDETGATVMAMEKGAKQMQRGLALLEEVAEATAQISLTTQHQRSATEQVVETMEQLAQANGQISSAAQEIASASAELAGLSLELEGQAATAASSI
ncbi:MAG: methyl-accepting chemotaxis protein [Actinomycetota bacterium]